MLSGTYKVKMATTLCADLNLKLWHEKQWGMFKLKYQKDYRTKANKPKINKNKESCVLTAEAARSAGPSATAT